MARLLLRNGEAWEVEIVDLSLRTKQGCEVRANTSVKFAASASGLLQLSVKGDRAARNPKQKRNQTNLGSASV